jgi:hypothetical protein
MVNAGQSYQQLIRFNDRAKKLDAKRRKLVTSGRSKPQLFVLRAPGMIIIAGAVGAVGGAGAVVGDFVGGTGDIVGDVVGDCVGSIGDIVGDFVGDFVGGLVGDFVGDLVGFFVGDLVGFLVGFLVGDFEGLFVGDFVTALQHFSLIVGLGPATNALQSAVSHCPI